MRHELRATVLLVASIAILGAATLHGLVNVPHLHEDLVETGVRHTLVAAVLLVLYFSVVAMFAFGGLVLAGAVGAFRGRQTARAALWAVSATYLVFGVAGAMLVSRSPHMLGYAGMGLLVAVGTALSSDDRRHG
jgi:hypothetical protein